MCKEFEMKAVANANSIGKSSGEMVIEEKDLFRVDEDDHHSSSYSNGSIVDQSSGDEFAADTSPVNFSNYPTAIKIIPSKRNQKRKTRVASSTIHRQLITRHEYHDHAFDPFVDSDVALSPRGKRNKVPSTAVNFTTPFPIKLYEMIDEIELQGLSNVVSWQPHGRCFKVHDVSTFKILLQNYFKLSKLASFQRQLNLYGFQRLTVGLDKGSYYHELFLRSRPDLVGRIERVKVKGTGVRAKSNPDDEPKLYSYPAVDARAEITSSTSCSSYSKSEDQEQTARVLSTAFDVASIPIYSTMGITVNPTPSYKELQGDSNDDAKASNVSNGSVTLQNPCSIMTGLVRNMSSLNVFPSDGYECSWRNNNMQNATFPMATYQRRMSPVPSSRILRNVSSCIMDHNSSFASMFSNNFATTDQANDLYQDQSNEQPLIMDKSGLNRNATDAVENLKADNETDDNVSFDKLVDEMFQHDQNIEFPELVLLATESDGKHPV